MMSKIQEPTYQINDQHDCKHLIRNLKPQSIQVIAICRRQPQPRLILVAECEKCQHFKDGEIRYINQCGKSF